MVIRWNDVAMDVLRADRTLPGPGWASRSLAMASLAIFDAVNSIERSYEPYLLAVPGFQKHTSMEAAIATAAHDVLVALYPGQKSFIDAELTESLATVPNGLRELKGVLLGKISAGAMLLARRHDGSARVVDHTVNPDPGHWEPDPINPDQLAWGPGWGQVRPFGIRRAGQFPAPPPPALGSPEYATSYNEVKQLGAKDSTTRTADQTEIGIFWAYDRAGMGAPPGMYCQQVKVVAEQMGNTQVENARLFALVNMAQADAGIAAWDSKYDYDFWRPITGIRRGEFDGNPETEGDPDWEPLGAPGGEGNPSFTPPFPAYVSGHATFGAAVFEVLADFYGSDQMNFTLHSDEMPGITRNYTSFSQAAAENARSRIYLGVHWNFDDIYGQAMGRSIGDHVVDHRLEPRDHRHNGSRGPIVTNLADGPTHVTLRDSAFSETPMVVTIGLSNGSTDSHELT
jgi:hypothetical protein